MTPNPIGNDARTARRARQLPADAACLTCGITNPVVLIAGGRTKPVSLVEEHHIAGWQVDNDLVAAQCLNCHAIRHEQLRSRGVNLRHPTLTVLEQQHRWLTAVGEFQHDLGDSAQRQATQLAALVGALDQDHASWRGLPEALPT